MSKLSQDAICELRQSLPLLEELTHVLNQYHEFAFYPLPEDEIQRLQTAYDRVSELTSPTSVETWVGSKPFCTSQEETAEESTWPTAFTDIREQTRLALSCATRLYLYVQGILESEEAEAILNHLTRENANLKEQLAELRRRESAYLSIIQEAQTSAAYSLPQESREILLDSLQRQHVTLTKNLTRLQETKAQYGLNTPLDILNAIDQTQEDLKRIEASIADLKAGSTATN